MFKNWKSTLAGAAAILAGVNALVQGQSPETALPSILAGLGLIFTADAKQ